ncbi:MAG: hypothetical protein V7L26_30065 [Nostoc sp.]|uniref:hypothetical protein n=1 Tax=Nostoc sp. TaxID=1180 RepID=UPI002FFAF58E
MATPVKQGYLMGTAPNQFTYVGLVADYADIGALIGVTPIVAGSPPPPGTPALGLRAALAYGKAFHVALSYKDVNGKRKRSKILVPADHLGAALGLVGQEFKGNIILGAVIPEHLTFG